MIYTDNYNLKKPEYGDTADIKDINDNTDDIDNLIHQNRTMIAPAFVTTKAYTTGDPVEYLGVSYIFIADKSAGPWDASKVEPKTAAEMGGSGTGGASALVDLDDVSIDTPTEGQALIYNEDDEVWENQTLPDPSVTKEASGNPIELTDAASAPMVRCVTEIQGSQDLHGQDKPWVGGAGKNKLPMTVDGIKAVNTGGTWNGNVYTSSGSNVTITILTDSDNNVIGIKVNGTFSSTWVFNLVTGALNGSYILTGCPQGGASDTYRLDVRDINSGVLTTDVGSGSNVTINNESVYGAIRIQTGTTVDNIIFYPMLRLSTVADATFAPYSNICPITAYTEGEIEVRGKNLVDQNDFVQGSISGAGVDAESTIRLRSPFIPVSPNTKYSVATNSNLLVYEIHSYNANKEWIRLANVSVTSYSFTNASDTYYLKILIRKTDNATILPSELTTFQLEKGNAPTTYEPYTSTTHTTTYPSAIYRGSEDVVNGEVTPNWVKAIFDGTENWNIHGSIASWFYVDNALTNAYTANDERNFSISNCYQQDEYRYATSLSDGKFIVGIPSGTTIRLAVKDTRFTTVADFKTWLSTNNLEIAYRLATPTTSSVTPTNLPIRTLSGYNHIESSTGDMEVEYITEEYQPLVDLIEANSGKHTYSTEEQVVGTWIDGSTIYERTIHIAASDLSSGSNTITHNISNFGKIIDQDGCMFMSNNYSNSLPLTSLNSNWMARAFDFNPTTFTFEIGYDVLSITTDIYVTIRYTKTTQTRSLNASLNTQKVQIEPLTDKTEEIPIEEENAVNEQKEEEKDVEDSSENQER